MHQDLLNHASHSFQTTMGKCKTNLQCHEPAVQSFVNNFHKISTDSQFNTALHTFNKSHLSATTASKIKSMYNKHQSRIGYLPELRQFRFLFLEQLQQGEDQLLAEVEDCMEQEG